MKYTTSIFGILILGMVIMLWKLFGNPNVHKNGGLKFRVEAAVKKLPWDIDSDKIIALIKPTIGIKTIRASDKPLETGKSKFGGLPDLPKHMDWPTHNDQPLAFVAQINLTESTAFDKNNQLPSSGFLYFFFLVEEDAVQFPDQEGEFSVLYYDGHASMLESRNLPENLVDLAKFKQCNLRFFEHYSLPAYQNYQIHDLALSGNDEDLLWEAYEIICTLTGCSPDIGHQLLGEAVAQQGDVNWWWAFRHLRFDSFKLNDDQNREIQNIEGHYILLFQVDFMDDNPGFSAFGGTGTAYFGIMRDDLKNKRFDRVILVFQTT